MRFSKCFLFITFILISVLVFNNCSNKIVIDSQLEKIISEQLLIPNHKLKKSDLLNLKELEIKEIELQSLDGLEYCINLERLVLQNCNLSEIKQLKYLTALKYLNIALNPEIKNISSIGYLKELEVFIASGTSIHDITPLHNNINLERIYLNNTKEITNINPLSSLHKLKVLEFYDNKVENLSSLSKLENIERLWINQNNIKDLSPIQYLTKLEYLITNHNLIEDIKPIQNLKKLTILDISFNNVSDISILNKLINNGSFKDTSYKVWWIKGINKSPVINLEGNPIDLSKNSINTKTIELIVSKKINLKYD